MRLARAVEQLRQPPPAAPARRDRRRCGARTRAGAPCRNAPTIDAPTGLPRNGRCKLHGGMSTGPRTPEGRAVALGNWRRMVERGRR